MKFTAKIIFLLSLFPMLSFAQTENSELKSPGELAESMPKWAVSVDPIYLLLSGVEVRVDRIMSPKYMLGAAAIYIASHPNVTADSAQATDPAQNYNWGYQALSLDGTMMLTGDAYHSGLYFNIGAGYQNSSVSQVLSQNYSGSLNSSMEYATLGFRWRNKSLFGCLGAGEQISQGGAVDVKDNSGNLIASEKISGAAGLKLDITFGLLF